MVSGALSRCVIFLKCFWHINISQGPGRQSAGQGESVESLQEELDALLRLERQQQQLLNKQNEISGTRGRKQPNLNWGGIGPGRQVSPLVTNLGSSGMKKVQGRGGGGVTPTPGSHLNLVTPTPGSSTGVVDIHVPKNQDVGFFGVGSSLSFSPNRPPQDSLALGSRPPSSPQVLSHSMHPQRLSSSRLCRCKDETPN